MPQLAEPRAVLEQWFGPCYAADFSAASIATCDPMWWGMRQGQPIERDERLAIDEALKTRFAPTLAEAKAGTLDAWLDDGPRGALALIILVDQLSRNVHRGSPEAFALDARSAEWALALVRSPNWTDLHPIERSFALLPLEHSEDLDLHRVCQTAFADLEQAAKDFPGHVQDRIRLSTSIFSDHFAVVRRFGRYPHRNAVLGRIDTPEERQYLDDGAQTWGQ